MNKTADSYYYGYIYKIVQDEESFDTSYYAIRMIDNNGSTKTYTIDKNIRYDGVSMSPEKGFDYLAMTAEMTNYDQGKNPTAMSQLVKYTLDSTARLSSISTVNNPGPQTDNLTRIDFNYTESGDKYNKVAYNYGSSSNGNFQSGNTKINVNSSTIVFVADPERTADSVRKSTLAKELKSGSKYLFEAFDEKSGVAKVLILYKQDGEDDKISHSTPLTIIQKKVASEATNKEGEIGLKLDGFTVGTSFAEKTGITTSDTVLYTQADGDGNKETVDFKLGDILKTVTNRYNDVYAVEKIWSPADPTDISSKYINASPVKENSAYYRTIVGYLYEQDEGSISIIPGVDLDNIDIEAKESFQISESATNCGYLVYDSSSEKDPVYKISFGELATATSYVDSPNEASLVLIQLTGSNVNNLTPKLIYIVK
jgi:hypothetical protein